jgi:hypothetical protein
LISFKVDAIKAVEITSRYPRVHGAPVHLGDPVYLIFINESTSLSLSVIYYRPALEYQICKNRTLEKRWISRRGRFQSSGHVE